MPSGQHRAPLLVRTSVVANLLGVSVDTIRRVMRERSVQPCQMHGKGPWYVSPRQAAHLALLVLGRQAESAYMDAVRRRAKAQRDHFGAFRTEARPVGTGGTGVEMPTSANAPTPCSGPA